MVIDMKRNMFLGIFCLLCGILCASLPVQAKEPVIHNQTVIEGREKWLFYALDSSIADYQGTNLMSENKMRRYLLKLNELHLLCEEKGKRVYYLIPPNKEQVYPEYMPDYPVQETYKRLPRLVDYIRANSGVRISYPLHELSVEKGICRTYLRNDTHWTNCGAYVGAQTLYQMMGLPLSPLIGQARSEIPVPDGDLIHLGRLPKEEYEGDFDYIVNYKPEILCVSPQESRFNELVYMSASTSENLCRAVVIGDSYALKMTPFLMKDFSHLMVVHRNLVHEPLVEQTIREADVIVIETLERLSHTLPATTEEVKMILQAETVGIGQTNPDKKSEKEM